MLLLQAASGQRRRQRSLQQRGAGDNGPASCTDSYMDTCEIFPFRRLQAGNAVGSSPYSSVAAVTTARPLPPPPTAVTAQAVTPEAAADAAAAAASRWISVPSDSCAHGLR